MFPLPAGSPFAQRGKDEASACWRSDTTPQIEQQSVYPWGRTGTYTMATSRLMRCEAAGSRHWR